MKTIDGIPADKHRKIYLAGSKAGFEIAYDLVLQKIEKQMKELGMKRSRKRFKK